jgi:hypothetical protein
MKSSAISGRTRNAERRLLPSVTFTIEGELPQLNDYIRAERGNRFAAASIKKHATARVRSEALSQKLPRLLRFDQLICVWYTRDARKDADNVAFAVKFVLDGLVDARVLPGDGRKFTGAILHSFLVDAKRPRVEVTIA